MDIPTVFLFTHDHIFDEVKQEASLFAERQFDENGEPLFDKLVFDEEYDEYMTLFRTLFFDAQAEVSAALSAHMEIDDGDAFYFEERDTSENRDYELTLLLPEDVRKNVIKAISIKIRQFLVAYILYRWFETKMPNISAIYFERLSKLKIEIQNMLNGRGRRAKIVHQLF